MAIYPGETSSPLDKNTNTLHSASKFEISLFFCIFFSLLDPDPDPIRTLEPETCVPLPYWFSKSLRRTILLVFKYIQE
jgi:hypothetical protein